MYSCDLLVVSCIDFRFQEKLRGFLEKEYNGNYDLVCMAGAAKNFVSGTETDKETVLKQVRISVELHQIKKLYLINHQNCGAYGSSLTSGTTEEREVHARDLVKAREQILLLFPTLDVSLFMIEFPVSDINQANFTKIDSL